MGNPEATHLYSDLKHLWAQGTDTNHQRIRDTLAQLKASLDHSCHMRAARERVPHLRPPRRHLA